MAFTAFSTALSALSANTTAINVVANNLSNLNTNGFKSSSVVFSDLVSQSLGSGDTQVGLGTAQPITVRQYTQGSLSSTGGSLDCAIQGDGFFVVSDANDTQLYTRAGNFEVDAEGNLVTVTGENVQGWTAVNGTVDTNAEISDIVVPVGTMSEPVATTEVSLNLNLNAEGVTGETTGAFSTPVEIVDSLGVTHTLTVNFTKTGENTWDYEVTIPGEEVAAGTSGTAYSVTTDTLTFDENGLLTDPAAPSTVAISIAGLTSGASDLSIEWALYDDSGASLMTQYSAESSLSAVAQNGSQASELTSVTVGDGGEVLAEYSNGEQKVVAQLAIASIRNPDSLVAKGDNNYALSEQSAEPAIGTAGTGGRGEIVGQAVEASNVDIAEELTNLIIYQRGYQANSSVVTTLDEITEETISMKR